MMLKLRVGFSSACIDILDDVRGIKHFVRLDSVRKC